MDDGEGYQMKRRIDVGFDPRDSIVQRGETKVGKRDSREEEQESKREKGIRETRERHLRVDRSE